MSEALQTLGMVTFIAGLIWLCDRACRWLDKWWARKCREAHREQMLRSRWGCNDYRDSLAKFRRINSRG